MGMEDREFEAELEWQPGEKYVRLVIVSEKANPTPGRTRRQVVAFDGGTVPALVTDLFKQASREAFNAE